MHSDICEDITGNSTNISPKPEAPDSSPGGDTSSATKSLGKPRILFFFWIFQNRAVGTISHT